MKILKLKLLLLKYQKELKSNNKEHLKDYIFIKCIANLNYNLIYLNEIRFNRMNYLLWEHGVPVNAYYKIPNLDEIEQIEKKLKKELKKIEKELESDPYFCRKKTFKIIAGLVTATWIKLMLQYEMISENKIIKLNEYKLNDFITDPKLEDILSTKNKNNDFNFGNYITDNEENYKVKNKR